MVSKSVFSPNIARYERFCIMLRVAPCRNPEILYAVLIVSIPSTRNLSITMPKAVFDTREITFVFIIFQKPTASCKDHYPNSHDHLPVYSDVILHGADTGGNDGQYLVWCSK
jgi:hypothetical protein